MRVNFASNKRESNVQLEHHNKRRADPIGPIVAFVKAPSSPVASLQLSPELARRLISTRICPSYPQVSPSVISVEEVSVEGSGGSYSCHGGLSAQEFLSLRFLVYEVSMVRLKYAAARQNELVETKAKLARVRKLYHKLARLINGQVVNLIERATIAELRVEGLISNLAVEKEGRVVVQVELEKAKAKHADMMS